MKLKTKFQDEDFDLGEVVEANVYYGGGGRIKVITEPTKGGIITFYFETLKGMNEMFEDYEEPKGNVKVEKSIIPTCVHIECSTEEEAELAVRKLKAWVRLKDKGFKFLCWNDDYTIDFTINGQNTESFKVDELSRDLCVVFGGGE